MRNRLVSVYFLIILLVFPLFISADDDAKTVVQAAKAKPVVYFNTNTVEPQATALNGGYKDFAESLSNAGFKVDQGYLTRLSDKFLDGIDVLVLSIPAFALLDSDKVALRKFIRSGGGVLVISHPNGSDNSNLDSITREFGIIFGQFSAGPFVFDVLQTTPLAAPNTCLEIGSPYQDSDNHDFLDVDTSKAVAVATNTKGKILAALSISKGLGKGKLVVLGSILPFYKIGSSNVLAYKDNLNFGLNTINYLANSNWDLAASYCKYKGKNLYPGDKFKAIAKIKNVSDIDSEKVSVSFFLSGNNFDGPASAEEKLKTIKLSPLAPGKTKKISTQVKLPTSLEPGNYTIQVKIDPEGLSADGNPENNMKAGKKKLVIN